MWARASEAFQEWMHAGETPEARRCRQVKEELFEYEDTGVPPLDFYEPAHASVIQNDFTAFLKKRSEALFQEIQKRIEPSEASAKSDPVHEMILHR